MAGGGHPLPFLNTIHVSNSCWKRPMGTRILSQIILRRKKCVKKLLKKLYGSWDTFLTILKHRACVKRLSKKNPRALELVSDWFVTQGQVKTCHDYNYYCNLDEWYEGYQKHKPKKWLQLKTFMDKDK